MSVFPNYKTAFLKKIFDKHKDKNIAFQFTKKSILYQYILKFFIEETNNNYYKITEIQNKVIPNLPYLFNKDKSINQSALNNNYHRTFTNYLKELESWNLLLSIHTSSSTGNIVTKAYTLSRLGKTIALFAKLIDYDDKQKLFAQIYDEWTAYFNDQTYSLDTFCMKYLQKCRVAGLFDEFIEFFGNHIIYDYPDVSNNNDLFTKMILVKLPDEQKNNILKDLWKKSYLEMDSEAQKLFTHHMKIHLDRVIERKINNFHNYEIARYNSRNADYGVIVEIQCSQCSNQDYYLIAMPVVKFINYNFCKPNGSKINLGTLTTCSTCKGNIFNFTMPNL